MNYQATFDKVMIHLARQGKRAVKREWAETDSWETCEYFAPDGTKCAIGCLIPERFNTPDLPVDLISVIHNPEIAEVLGINFEKFNNDYKFLRALQKIHDSEYN